MAIPRFSFVLVCLLGSSCASLVPAPTPAQRAASFAPYANGQIGDLAIHPFLALRYAVLTDKAHSLGAAAAIDRRGYYVTATHCLRDEAPWLLVPRLEAGGQQATFEKEECRIVWRGNQRSGDPDFAILSVSRPIDWVFDWAKEVKNGDVAIAAGVNYEKHFDDGFNAAVECIAGVISRSYPHGDSVPTHTMIEYSAPLHHGDSGGPVATVEGLLLGVNSDIVVWLYLPSLSRSTPIAVAVRPDLAWLRRLIDEDYAKHALTKKPNKAPEPTPTAVTPRAIE